MYRPYGNSVPNSSPLLDVETTIRGLTQDYCTAFNTGNYDQVAALFASDGLYMAPHREPMQGPRKRLSGFCCNLASGDFRTCAWKPRASITPGTWWWRLGVTRLESTNRTGTTIADRGKFVHAWRRLGAWLLVADSWSSNLPGGTDPNPSS